MEKTKPRVAVVEDDDDLRDNMLYFLNAYGYPVWGAESGEALFRRLVADEVDVLVLDVGLPGEDGFAIARCAAQSRTMAVIILSGRDSQNDRQTGLNSGADLYLVKPVDLRELMASIDAVWQKQALRIH
jgi:two-component system, OmpR family, response regulator PhoP